jgi:DNA polymerase III alpha subunit
MRVIAEQFVYMSEFNLGHWCSTSVIQICTDSTKNVLHFELATIERMGYPGYFLIVADFIAEARKMGVSVGPGRGSAAGSAIAYCLGLLTLTRLSSISSLSVS